ncbi:MAG: SPASM domain-containing protein [Endomicrobiales bacterium]|nr:SPASM domain-containing protein [Endomicrobiales bacterium]
MKDLKDSNRKLINSQIINGEHEITAFPYQMFIDPSNLCNLKCPFCANFARRNNYLKEGTNPLMSFDVFKKIIDETGPYLTKIIFGDKSEPLVNKDIYRMISYVKKYDIYCLLSTNFNLFEKKHAEELVLSGLDCIHIGFEGTNQESYSRYRVGGNFNKVIENIKALVETKKKLKSKTPHLQWAYVVFKHNEEEIDAAIKMSKDLEMDGFGCIPADIYNIQENYKEWLPKNEKYTKYRIHRSGTDIKVMHLDGPSCVETDIKDLKIPCILPWTMVSIDSNGDVYPCNCGDVREGKGFGNISRSSFKDIWNNNQYKEMRQFLLTGKKTTENSIYCESCYTANKSELIFSK